MLRRSLVLLTIAAGWLVGLSEVAARDYFVSTTGDDARNGLGRDTAFATIQKVKRATPPVKKLLSGEQEAKIIAMRLGVPPQGFGKWTLRLLARKIVEREIAPAVSHSTVARTLRKTK